MGNQYMMIRKRKGVEKIWKASYKIMTDENKKKK